MRQDLGELTRLFLRLGFTAFGGPAAHIALMREEVVVRRQWMSEAEFLDLLGAVNLIPGPNSTELAIHIGFQRGRWAGLLLAGLCFILPAALMVAGCAWAYVRFGALPQVVGVLRMVKPVVVAVVVQAIWGLAKSAVKGSIALGVLTAAVFGLALAGVDELALLFGAGALAGIVRWGREHPLGLRPLLALLLMLAALGGLPTLLTHLLPISADPTSPGALFAYFLKIGATLYGSGYVLLAFLRDGLVGHGLSEAQLLDAVAVGQVTPGPVFTTATFVGYVLGGPFGALAATSGIFLPSFLFVAVSGPLLPRLRRSPLMGAFLDGVNAAALALMAAVSVQIARAALVDPLTIALTVVSAVLLVRFKVNATWLILASAVLGVGATLVWPGR